MGSQLDQLTVSHLLIPAPHGKDYVYDVNLVLRLLKFFQIESKLFLFQLCNFEKVTKLMDSYLMEVAPDSHLKASKFSALAMAMSHSRESHDKLYQAIDLYFQVNQLSFHLIWMKNVGFFTWNPKLILFRRELTLKFWFWYRFMLNYVKMKRSESVLHWTIVSYLMKLWSIWHKIQNFLVEEQSNLGFPSKIAL